MSIHMTHTPNENIKSIQEKSETHIVSIPDDLPQDTRRTALSLSSHVGLSGEPLIEVSVLEMLLMEER